MDVEMEGTKESRGQRRWLEELMQCMSSFQVLTWVGTGSLIFEQFVEYDSRAHRLHTLATFSYWVSSTLIRLTPIALISVDMSIRSASHSKPAYFALAHLSPCLTSQN